MEKKELYDNVYTEQYLNDLIEATYEVAFSVYIKYTWGPRTLITFDDYRQEAAMEVVRLFKSRFITPPKENYTKTNLKTYIYSILDKYFTINLINTEVRRTYHKVAADELDTNNFVDSNHANPDKEDNYIRGAEELNSLMSLNLTKEPYNTRKHKYIDSDGTELSEYLMAQHILAGDRIIDVLEKYSDNDNSRVKYNQITRWYNESIDKLTELITKDAGHNKDNIIKYLLDRR